MIEPAPHEPLIPELETGAVRAVTDPRLAGRRAGEWARSRGIDGRSLNAWKVNLARRGTTAAPRRSKPKAPLPAPALIELVPPDSIGKRAAGGRYVLEVSGARVEFDDHCSVATLRRVLEALRSC